MEFNLDFTNESADWNGVKLKTNPMEIKFHFNKCNPIKIKWINDSRETIGPLESSAGIKAIHDPIQSNLMNLRHIIVLAWVYK